MSTGEVIHESETGGKKAGNLERYDLIPPREWRVLAAFYGTPYADAYLGGSFNELHNQLNLFWEGDDVDPETGYLRLVLVAFQAMELLAQETQHGTQRVETEDGIYRFDHMPSEPLRLLAQHYGRGALKYDDDNWQKGYDWRLSFAALNRHLWQHQSGQFLDEETGSPHLVAVVWHAITLLWFYENRPEFDTRTSTKQKTEEGFRAPQNAVKTAVDTTIGVLEEVFGVSAEPVDTDALQVLIKDLQEPIYEDTTLAQIQPRQEQQPEKPERPDWVDRFFPGVA